MVPHVGAYSAELAQKTTASSVAGWLYRSGIGETILTLLHRNESAKRTCDSPLTDCSRKRIIAMKSLLQNGRTATETITMGQMLKQNSFVLQKLMSFMYICKCNLGNLSTFFVYKIKMT